MSPAASGAPLLDVHRLSVRFGGLVAVSELDLEVPAGSIVSIIGPNGAGKTTAFNCISGIYQPSSGTIRFHGRRLQRAFTAATFWQAMAVGLLTGLLVTGSTLACGWGLAPSALHCQRPIRDEGTTRRLLSRVGRNGRFLRVLGLYLLLWCGLQIMQTAALIYLPVVLRLPESWSNWILLPFMVSTLAGLWVWNGVSRRGGRIRALHLGSALWIGGCALAMVLPPLNAAITPLGSAGNIARLVLLVGTIVVAGLGASCAYLIPWSMLPDIIELDELQTGQRREGVFYSFMVLLQKIGLALGLFLVGQALEWSGFIESLPGQPDPAQPASALMAIRFAVGPLPTVCLIAGLFLTYFYPITREVHAEIMLKLNERKNGNDIH